MKRLGEAQIPARGIMETGDFGDSKYYRIACSCGQPSDDIQMNVELDHGQVTVHFWTEVQTCWWKERFNTFNSIDNPFMYTVKRWANDILNRASVIWTVLTKGYVEMESWTVMNKQQALNLASTIERAINDVEEAARPRKSKRKPKPLPVDDVLADTYKV